MILNGLPSTGAWTIIRTPGEVNTTGSGAAFTVTGLEAGDYTFRVETIDGCFSSESEVVVISIPEIPLLIITDPAAGL